MAIQFRIAQSDDAAGILAIYAPHCESTCVSFETLAPTPEQMSERIARILATHPWLVCEAEGQLAGYVYASRHRERAAYCWAVDTAVYVSPEYRRCGVGQGLYHSLFAVLREQGFRKAYAGITLPNAASVGLHEAVGFQPIAVYRSVGYKLGRWLDVGWWQLNLQPEVANPREPLPFSQLRDGPDMDVIISTGQRFVRDKPR